MASQKNIISLFTTLFRWRKFIIIVIVLAAAISTIIALRKPDYYKSTAIFYPSNIATYDRVILFSTESSDKVLNYFGTKEDVSRMLAIARSNDLIDDVIQKFDLAKSYGIDSSSNRWRFKVRKQFESNYKAIRTELGNIELSIWDQNPQTASEMVNYIMNETDRINTAMVVDRYKGISEKINVQLTEKGRALQKLTDSLAAFRDTSKVIYRLTRKTTYKYLKDYNNLQTLEDQYAFSANNDFSSIYVIEKAKPADKKSKPVRWLIVVSSLLIALLFSIFAILLIEQYKLISSSIRDAN